MSLFFSFEFDPMLSPLVSQVASKVLTETADSAVIPDQDSSLCDWLLCGRNVAAGKLAVAGMAGVETEAEYLVGSAGG
jgi:hypothetical protein